MGLGFQLGVNNSSIIFSGLVPANAVCSEVGASWMRAPQKWETIDPLLGSGTYPADYVTASATAINTCASQCAVLGMKLLVPVTVGTGGGLFPAGSTAAEYAAMMAWLVGQCPGLTWEILNEPDVSGTSPTVYTGVVQAAYPAMKAADPTCTVGAMVLGEINTGPTGGQHYMLACYDLGIKGSYDFISFHPYANMTAGTYPPNWDPGTVTTPLIQAFQAQMATFSDTAPLWVTEFGWDTSGTLATTLTQQAQFLVQQLTDFNSLGISVAMIFNATDGNPPNWGLATAGVTPKPSFYAIQDLTSAVETRFIEVNGNRLRLTV